MSKRRSTRAWQGGSQMHVRIRQFELKDPRQAEEMGRRARILAALLGLPARRRQELAEALELLCQSCGSSSRGMQVGFSLGQRDGQRCLEVTVAPATPERGSKQAGASMPRSEPQMVLPVRRLREMLDFVEAAEENGNITVIRFGQLVAPGFRLPSDRELDQWAAWLEQPSLEDVLAALHRSMQSLATELGQVRSQVDLGHKLGTTLDGENLAMLSLVISRSHNAITVMDRSGVITWVNEAFVRMTGYLPEEAIGRRLDELLFGPSTAPESIEAFRAALERGQELVQDTLRYRKDGQTFWVECNLTPVFGQDGQLRRWISIDSDITQRHQQEEALRRAKEAAEASSRAKSEFLANVSHEIRTPMNAIIGMTELALATRLTPEQREYLTVVHDSATSLLQLLNDILDFSKIESGKLVLESIEFSPADVVRETLRAFSARIHEKGLLLRVDAPATLPEIAVGDPTRLRQILSNLIDNAVKFTERGSITVRVEEQWRTADAVGLHVVVEDTGIGIPADRLDRIFESFTQADASTTRQFGGTGLGLSITAELVERMQGRIWVQSREGEGSAFHFTVRLGLHPPRPMTDPAYLRGVRVTVESENRDDGRVLREWLDAWGAEIAGEGSGDVGAERGTTPERPLDGSANHWLLLDLPVADMLRRLESMSLGNAVAEHDVWNRIIVLSNEDRAGLAARFHELGVDLWLPKPVSRSQLRDGILQLIGDAPVSPSAAPTQVKKANEGDQMGRPARGSVLIADDHDANRLLARRILEREGYRVTQARDGQEVVDAYRADPPDVILMDVQMPGMDGLEAIRQIRQLESEGGPPVRIVALTAHALPEDRARCLAAGADDYLAKPLRKADLLRAVERSLRRAAPATAGGSPDIRRTGSSTKDHDAPAFDLAAALERMDGDRDLLAEQMRFFLHDAPELLSELDQAVRQADAKGMELAAHRLKGLVAGYGATRAAELAQRLERAGQQGSTASCQNWLATLRTDVDSLMRAISEYLKEQELLS